MMEGLIMTSYNCRGLPKTKNKLVSWPDILEVFKESDIIGFQETHYSKQDNKNLNCIHNSFIGIGAAKIDESSGIIQGRYPGRML